MARGIGTLMRIGLLASGAIAPVMSADTSGKALEIVSSRLGSARIERELGRALRPAPAALSSELRAWRRCFRQVGRITICIRAASEESADSQTHGASAFRSSLDSCLASSLGRLGRLEPAHLLAGI